MTYTHSRLIPNSRDLFSIRRGGWRKKTRCHHLFCHFLLFAVVVWSERSGKACLMTAAAESQKADDRRCEGKTPYLSYECVVLLFRCALVGAHDKEMSDDVVNKSLSLWFELSAQQVCAILNCGFSPPQFSFYDL